ncbi:MAG: PilZ domain-containing protein [Nitrospirota bacterium]|nr:PilZ domain-containing protein [Nitrospirota bacterium]
MAHGKDLRRSARYPVVGLATVEVLPGLDVLEGYVANFGTHGVGLYVRDPLAPGDHVHITLAIDGVPDMDVAERYQGNVVWINQVGGVFAVGIEFLDEQGGCPYAASFRQG